MSSQLRKIRRNYQERIDGKGRGRSVKAHKRLINKILTRGRPRRKK